MEPAIKNQQHVLTSKIPYLFSEPDVKEIVAFNLKGKVLIKRIQKKMGNKYFLTGDNSKDSFDSRSFGSISKSDILGKVIYIF
jgi:type IV secretory pathway protease TraF